MKKEQRDRISKVLADRAELAQHRQALEHIAPIGAMGVPRSVERWRELRPSLNIEDQTGTYVPLPQPMPMWRRALDMLDPTADMRRRAPLPPMPPFNPNENLEKELAGVPLPGLAYDAGFDDLNDFSGFGGLIPLENRRGPR